MIINRNSVGFRILLLPLIGLTGFIALGAIALIALNTSLMANKETQLRAVVEIAHGIVSHYQQQELGGSIDRATAQTQARLALKAMRYDGNEYFWIHDSAVPYPTMVMHPTVPALEGQTLSDSKFNKGTQSRDVAGNNVATLDGRNLFQAMNEVITKFGEGYVSYEWPKPLKSGGVSPELHTKLSFVKKFEPWGWVIGSGVYLDDLHTAYWQIARWLLGLTVLGVLIMLVFSVRIKNWVLDKLGGEVEDAVAVANRISLGNLATAVPSSAPDSLMSALEQMRLSLNTLVSSIFVNTRELSSEMGLLTSDASNMDVRLAMQITAAEEVMDAVETMQQKIQQIAALADETRGHAHEIARRTTEGSAVVAVASDGMQQISLTINRSAASVQQLVSKASDIGNIVKIIREVADQTNLLALNAAIEAARAGEMGRGFAVVADEVRKLAERTAKATSEISNMIGLIQGEIGQVVSEMSSAVPLVNAGVASTDSTATLLMDFRSSSNDTLARMESLGAVVREQVTSGQNVVGIVSQSLAITRQAVAVIQDTLKAAASAEKHSHALAAVAARYDTGHELVPDKPPVFAAVPIPATMQMSRPAPVSLPPPSGGGGDIELF